MAETVTAVYENGVLRPLRPLKLRERQTVRLQIVPEEPTDNEEEAAIQLLIEAGTLTLVKRYVTETGSDWIRALTDPAARNPLVIARVTWVEVLSALARRQREGSITSNPNSHS